jgi:hypothetical protein
MWKKYCRVGQATDDNMALAQRMLETKGYKYTHSGCVILIAFPQQKLLHEYASVSHCTYIACHVSLCIGCILPAMFPFVSAVYFLHSVFLFFKTQNTL